MDFGLAAAIKRHLPRAVYRPDSALSGAALQDRTRLFIDADQCRGGDLLHQLRGPMLTEVIMMRQDACIRDKVESLQDFLCLWIVIMLA